MTIALGSTLTTILLSKETSLAQGLAALLLLVVLQFVVTWVSVRWQSVSDLLKTKEKLLLSKGELQKQRAAPDAGDAGRSPGGAALQCDKAALAAWIIDPHRRGGIPLSLTSEQICETIGRSIAARYAVMTAAIGISVGTGQLGEQSDESRSQENQSLKNQIRFGGQLSSEVAARIFSRRTSRRLRKWWCSRSAARSSSCSASCFSHS
ncbi:MAG TPA: hypothetical protein VGF73_06125 [Chthoniobacterales bacterium]